MNCGFSGEAPAAVSVLITLLSDLSLDNHAPFHAPFHACSSVLGTGNQSHGQVLWLPVSNLLIYLLIYQGYQGQCTNYSETFEQGTARHSTIAKLNVANRISLNLGQPLYEGQNTCPRACMAVVQRLIRLYIELEISNTALSAIVAVYYHHSRKRSYIISLYKLQLESKPHASF